MYMLGFIMSYQWEIFIAIEILSFMFLLSFLIVRYAFTKQKLSAWFLILFLLCIVLEAVLALLVYQETGEISTFQIVIAIFVVYACTLGISDFRKLDRYIKGKIGKWRGVNLLTDEEIRKIELAKDPEVIARRNRRWWYVHATIFAIGHYLFWLYDGNHHHDLMFYIEDLSWWGEVDHTQGPFQSEAIAAVNKIWVIIFALDTIISWSYTLFPSKKKN